MKKDNGMKQDNKRY